MRRIEHRGMEAPATRSKGKHTRMITSSLTQTKALMMSALRSDTPIHLIGAPGIGKTEITHQVGSLWSAYCKADRPVIPCILSQMDMADVGGIPVPDPVTGRVLRLPMGPIRRASEAPCILFLDEYLNAHPALQGASLTLILERWAGDFKLHPETRLILASNPVALSAGGHEQTLPSLGRMRQINVEPTIDEVRTFMRTIGEDTPTGVKAGAQTRAQVLRDLGWDLSATLGADPGLLQNTPPPSAATSGESWACGRNYVRAFGALADLFTEGGCVHPANGPLDPLVVATLAGDIGETQAHALIAMWRTRNKLPTKEEIIADPKGSKLPTDSASGVAAIGLLANVGRTDACAGWIYASRLSDEIKVASARALFPMMLDNKNARYMEANKIKIGLLASISSSISQGGFI